MYALKLTKKEKKKGFFIYFFFTREPFIALRNGATMRRVADI